MNVNDYWLVKYQPKKLDDLILPAEYIEAFKGKPMNHLFSGTQGSGKTTAAKALAMYYTHGDKQAILQINASETSGIDMVRNQISDFCQTVSLGSSGIKVVILDEIDYLTSQAQAAMRGTIEKFANNAYFIGTCNYPDRLIPALRDSRLKESSFNFSGDVQAELMLKCMNRIISILKENNMTIDKDAIVTLIKKRWPDYRAILQTLYFVYNAGRTHVTMDDINKFATSRYAELYEFIATVKDPREHYKFMMQFKGREQDIIAALSSDFCTWCFEKIEAEPDKFRCSLGDIVVLSHKYGVDSRSSLDMFITLLALTNELSRHLELKR